METMGRQGQRVLERKTENAVISRHGRLYLQIQVRWKKISKAAEHVTFLLRVKRCTVIAWNFTRSRDSCGVLDVSSKPTLFSAR